MEEQCEEENLEALPAKTVFLETLHSTKVYRRGRVRGEILRIVLLLVH